ncbi:LptF/LptG family permease [Treponema sp. Marseille-Q4132]|uniref:LptF/LptG family permease n=1 Tax=Treponema sp. Marseille-Q4132 TaxID=2766701 RepID=UPI001652C32C|nr:LptF/LptG family permease [Treponema sp. Marseille-Q4132]QNL96974.1 LptF/LptG family permease [Treponema sp. Marseille-Q4132]
MKRRSADSDGPYFSAFQRYLSALKNRFTAFMADVRTKFFADSLRSHVLTRYLVRELLLYFSVAFLFFFTIFFVNQILLIAEHILRQGAPVWDVVKLMTYSLPFIVAQSSPFATLVGFLMCLGRFMSDNEIIIFRASGFSYVHILCPVLVLGLTISIASFFVNDYLLPLGTIRYNRLRRMILSSNPAVALDSHSVKRLNTATLVTGDVADTKVSDLVIIDMGSDGKMRIISAGESELKSVRKEGVLMQLTMTDALALFFNTTSFSDYDLLSSDRVTFNLFESAFFNDSGSTSPREMTSYDLGRALRDMRKDASSDKRTLNNYTLEYNKKFSLPFGSLFFALLALPLAFLFGRQNGQTIGMIVGIIISFLYWTMMILGQYASSRNGFNGFWSMWIPNIVTGAAGAAFYIALKRR